MFEKFYWLILCALSIHKEQKCILNSRRDFSQPQPIILRYGKLLEPDDSEGNVELNNGDVLTLSCEGSGDILHPRATQQLSTASIKCVSGNDFRNDDWLLPSGTFSYFNCPYPPNYVSFLTNRTCFEGNRIIEVGYTVENTFYPVYESCFDSNNLNAIYSKYTQKPYNALYQTNVIRPFFVDDGNYGTVHVNFLYSPKGLKAAVAQLVGNRIDSYVTNTQSLSRGHLAAKTDFVFAFGERATFHYVNCAPQWTGFNGGNWNTLEVDLRNHIHSAGYDTIIYTGTYGVTQLQNQVNQRVDLYLYTDINNNPIIPVPQYYYKVVYEPSTQRGIAFVGINNPYYTASEARELFFCEDICRGNSMFTRWLSWHPDNPNEGYTFCCSIPDFRNTIKHLPHFEIKGLLT